MKARFVAPLVIGFLVLAGCGTTQRYSQPAAEDLLAGAHASLDRDDTTAAREWLASAKPKLRTGSQVRMHALLEAEVDLRTGEPERALATAGSLLEEHPEDPRVHELTGKAQLVLGEYPSAMQHFDVAARRYEDAADVSRARDLHALSRGLEAYAFGRVSAAREAWMTIADPRLRASVLAASPPAAASAATRRHMFAATNP